MKTIQPKDRKEEILCKMLKIGYKTLSPKIRDDSLMLIENQQERN